MLAAHTSMRRSDRDRAVPRSVIAAGVVLSVALHSALLVFIERSLIQEPREPETIVTVNLIASRPAVASQTSQAAGVRTPLTGENPLEHIHDRTDMVIAELSPSPALRVRGVSPSPRLGTKSRTSPHNSELEAKAIPSPRQAYVDNEARSTSSDYLAALAHQLATVEHYPDDAVARREEGVVVVSLRLHRSGRVISWAIDSSAGHRVLDDEVAEMIRAAAPFPPFPQTWSEVDATFLVPIRFSLR